MSWTKKKKLQAAGIIVLVLGFVVGGLTVYANGLNRREQAIFTTAEALAVQDAAEIREDSSQETENETGDAGSIQGTAAPGGFSAVENTSLQEVSEEVEPLLVAALELEAEEETVGVVNTNPLRKAFVESPKNKRVVDPDKPMVALTYDDGPYSAVTDRILDALETHGGRATFFVVGNRVANYPGTMNRIVSEGHEVGNHSYRHAKYTSLNEEEIRQDINDTQYTIAHTTEVSPVLLRLPYGAKNNLVMETVELPMIQWSLDTLDWKTRDAQSTINRVLNTVKDGDIILMHDLYPATAEASESLIPALIDSGYQLVTVSELYAARGIEIDGHTLYYSAPPENAPDDGSAQQEVELYEVMSNEVK